MNVGGRTPSLVRLSHRPSGSPVQPFVELPLPVDALVTGFGKTHQLPMGELDSPGGGQVAHPQAADKGPDTAVVVMIWEVQEVDQEIVFPVVGTRKNGWVKAVKRFFQSLR